MKLTHLIDKVTISVPVVSEKILLMQETDVGTHTEEENNDNGPRMEENSTWNKADIQWNQANTVEISLSLVRVS